MSFSRHSTPFLGCRLIVMIGVLLAASFLPWSSVKADVTKRGEKAKKSDVELNIPEARGVAAQFIAGEKVEIELVAATSSLKAVTFLIRQQPQHGFLSEIRPHPTDNHKALVTYQHLDRNAQLNDIFTYACRIDGGSFSAPASVNLSGSKFDPILEVTRQPQFGRIFVGGQATSRVEVKNNGAASYKQALTWESPWNGPPELEVPSGKSVEFIVTFTPVKSGNYRLELPLQAEVNNSVVALFADAIPALTASPSRVVLKWDPKTKERSAMLTLANSKLDIVEVSLSLPERLKGPKTLTINPQSKQEIRLFLPASDVAAFKGSVAVTSGEIVEPVTVDSIAQPAEIKLVSPDNHVIDFRVLDRYEKKEQEFIIENSGGQDLLANILARPPFAVEEAGQVIRLQPGQQRRFVMQLDSRNAGLFETTMDISGASQKVVVKLVADIHEVPDKPAMAANQESKAATQTSAPAQIKPTAPSSTPDTATKSTPSVPVVTTGSNNNDPQNASVVTDENRTRPALLDAMVGERPKEQTRQDLRDEQARGLLKSAMDMVGVSRLTPDAVNLNLEAVKFVEAQDVASSDLTLAWNKPSIQPASWRIESATEVKDPATGLFAKIWMPVMDVEPVNLSDRDSNKYGIRIKALQPASQYEFRVLGVDAEGKLSMPSPVLTVYTLSPWKMPAWAWRVLILTALGLALYILYRVRRGEFELEF